MKKYFITISYKEIVNAMVVDIDLYNKYILNEPVDTDLITYKLPNNTIYKRVIVLKGSTSYKTEQYTNIIVMLFIVIGTFLLSYILRMVHKRKKAK